MPISLILSKILLLFIYPLLLILWLITLSILIVSRRKKAALGLLFGSVGILWLFSTPACSSYIVSSLEWQFLPVSVDESPAADAIVVLGGGVAGAEPPRLELDLSDAADRVLHAVRLYRAGKAPVVIASGRGFAWSESITPESHNIKALLQEWSVPAYASVMEAESRNTFENAVYTKSVMDEQGLKTILLVTSALHMKRALSVFRAMGIDAIPSPTDYRTVYRKKLTIRYFLPNIEALAGTTRAVKEYTGFLYYWLQGWNR